MIVDFGGGIFITKFPVKFREKALGYTLFVVDYMVARFLDSTSISI